MKAFLGRRSGLIFALSVLVASDRVTAQDGVVFMESMTAAAELQAGAKHDALSSDSGRLEKTISGGEKSSCHAGNDRASSASINVRASVTDRTTDAIGMRLQASTRVNGAHYRTCSSCIAGLCVGIHGNDASAFAAVRASGEVRVHLPTSNPSDRFRIRVATSGESAEQVEFSLVDPALGAVLTDHSNSGEAVVSGGQAREIVFAANLKVSAFDEGGCCSAQEEGSADVQLQVEASDAVVSDAEYLVTSMEEAAAPRVAGGKAVTGYAEVGALLYDGTSGELCTATVVAGRTLVTAAHCVRGKATNRLTFVVGPSINSTDIKRESIFQVVEVTTPDGSTPGFNYDALIFADDLALVYVDRPLTLSDRRDPTKLIPIQPVLLHAGTPALRDLQELGQPFLFLGYGYDDFAGGSGRGDKRRVEMQISQLASTTFENRAPGQNTCKGDSGGPVLLVENSKTYLVGVVSKGDKLCKNFGINTRVDAFAPWIQGRLKD